MPYTMFDKNTYYLCDFRGGDFFETNKEHMKNELERLSWKDKKWIAEKTPRNTNIFRRLNGENIYDIYEKEREDIHEILNYANSFMDINKLKSYQIDMISHIQTRHRCVCGAEMRMGKTLPTLIFLSYLSKNYDEKLAFVTTKNAKYGIYFEIAKWQIPELDSLEIINYDYFTDYYDEIPFCIVFDEAQKLKNESLRTFKAISLVQKQLNTFEESYVILNSGTPAPNHQDDWYFLTEICLPGFLAENSKSKLRQRLSFWHIEESLTGGKYCKIDAWKPEEIRKLGEERLIGLVEVYSKAKYLPELLPPKREIWQIPRSSQVNMILKALPKLYKNNSQLRVAIAKLSDGIHDGKFFQTEKDRQLSKLIDEHEDIGRFVLVAFFKETITKLTKILIHHDWNILRITGDGIASINSKYSSEELLREMDESQKQLHDEKIISIIQADICEGLELSASPIIAFYSNSKRSDSRMQMEARINSLNSKFTNQRVVDFIYFDQDLANYTQLLNKQTLSKVVLNTIEMTEKERQKYYASLSDVTIYNYVEDQSYDYLLEPEECEEFEYDEEDF